MATKPQNRSSSIVSQCCTSKLISNDSPKLAGPSRSDCTTHAPCTSDFLFCLERRATAVQQLRLDDADTDAAAQCTRDLWAALGREEGVDAQAGVVNTWGQNLETVAPLVQQFIADRFPLSDWKPGRRRTSARD